MLYLRNIEREETYTAEPSSELIGLSRRQTRVAATAALPSSGLRPGLRDLSRSPRAQRRCSRSAGSSGTSFGNSPGGLAVKFVTLQDPTVVEDLIFG